MREMTSEGFRESVRSGIQHLFLLFADAKQDTETVGVALTKNISKQISHCTLLLPSNQTTKRFPDL